MKKRVKKKGTGEKKKGAGQTTPVPFFLSSAEVVVGGRAAAGDTRRLLGSLSLVLDENKEIGPGRAGVDGERDAGDQRFILPRDRHRHDPQPDDQHLLQRPAETLVEAELR